MKITLYKNNSTNNTLDKDLTQVFEIEGQLKESIDVLNPNITIEVSEDDFDNFISCNYMYITKFKRYYYITGFTALNSTDSNTKHILTVSGHVDVLQTYKSAIKDCHGIVKKSASSDTYNLYIDDGSLKAYQNSTIVTKKFSSGFSGQSYILVVAGGSGSDS